MSAVHRTDVTGVAMIKEASDASAGSVKPTVYHIGPWRYVWVPCLFGFFALGLALLAIGEEPGERMPLFAGAGAFVLIIVFILALVRAAKLEIGPRGVALKQVGYRLEADWSDVTSVWLDRGEEGFVTAVPVRGKGAARLAGAAAAMPYTGYAWYDDEQQALLDAHRFIPIEAFAWHLRHGTLRRQIEAFAPHLADDLRALDAPASRATNSDWRDVVPRRIALILGLTMLGIAIGFLADKKTLDRIDTVVFSITDPFYTLCGAIAAWHLLRRRRWFMGMTMVLLTLFGIAWTVIDWGRLAAIFGA